ncbi:hypothetical protein [Saccharothrix algeriensis]|uniref:Tyr recombinase domain-containing protein n=1 Tax=Saccharothrix algeriensis TaxID=173560 RepID=A0ABS2S7F7_9PSEU|nr:hypothetical protein [Saccharothrix algeriensis]MBM7811016.1 hypothetical protein [Saccharothrix algeriensis]
MGKGSLLWSVVFVGPKRSNFWGSGMHRITAGIRDVHLYDLRHTGNMSAAETGVTLRELTDRMGHSSTRVAMILLHAREEGGRKIAVGIGAMAMAGTLAKGTAGAIRGTWGARKIKKGGKIVHLGRTTRRLPAERGESG